MNCEWAKKNILLYVYNELPDDARYELEQHVSRCADCAGELSDIRELHDKLAVFPIEEPSPNLMAASRMRLSEALESAEQGGFWSRLLFAPAIWIRQMRLSPGLVAAILVIGFSGGMGTAYKMFSRNPAPRVLPPDGVVQPADYSVSGIRSIAQEPGSNQVQIKYDTVYTQEAQGSLTDPRIQQLLLFATRNNYNSGVRLDSVDLLTQQPQDQSAREALIYALRYDSNPGVRLKALGGLGNYVKNDVQVRNALLEALMNDPNPGVRIEALHLLQPVRADSMVRQVLERTARKDANPYLRSQAGMMLAQMPEMD
jgi:HEAT repeats/Putative zinc-finger